MLGARLTGLAIAAVLILGPLASLAVWSLAERWTYPSPWPQRWGFRYWARMLSGDFLEPLRTGLVDRRHRDAARARVCGPLGYALARLSFPGGR